MRDQRAQRRKKPALPPSSGGITSLCSVPPAPAKLAYPGCSFFQSNHGPWVWVKSFFLVISTVYRWSQLPAVDNVRLPPGALFAFSTFLSHCVISF